MKSKKTDTRVAKVVFAAVLVALAGVHGAESMLGIHRGPCTVGVSLFFPQQAVEPAGECPTEHDGAQSAGKSQFILERPSGKVDPQNGLARVWVVHHGEQWSTFHCHWLGDFFGGLFLDDVSEATVQVVPHVFA